ncbi:hypothetical protein PV328_012408, partial [Microctonus aethiopoides]
MRIVIDEVNSVWCKAKIPLMRVSSSVRKLKNLRSKNVCLTNEPARFLDDERKNQGQGHRGIISFNLEKINSGSEESLE